MAKQSSVNLDITNNADGFDISGGTTVRKLGITGGDITIAGSGSATVTFPTTSTTIAGLGITQSFSALQTFSAGISASGATFSGNISAPNIVTSVNGLTGAVTGVSSIRGITGIVGITNGIGIGLGVSGQTMTISNTGVLSINGGTGAVTNVAKTNVDNNFSSAQTIDASGAYLEIVGGAGNAFTLTPGVGIVVSDSVNSPQTLQFNQTGTTTTVTLPNYTTTLAGLAGNQTFTALNSFNAGISASGATFSGDIAVNGGDITTTSATATLYNTTATTVNIGNAASTVNLMGATANTRTGVGSKCYIKTGQTTTTTTAKQEIFRYVTGLSGTPDTSFADIIITANSPLFSQITKILVANYDNISINHTEYGNVNIGGNLAVYTAELSSSNVIIYATPILSPTTFNVYATLIKGTYGVEE